MGKFDGVLFFSDYDDTLYNHRLEVSQENRDAIHYFIKEGGRFSIATGRAHRTFTPQIELERLEFNAPVVLSNGAAIYDYTQDRYLVETFLPPDTPERMAEVCARFPELAFEAYYGEDIYLYNSNIVSETHLKRVGVPYFQCAIEDMPRPWIKVIMEQDEPYLKDIQAFILDRWGDEFEAIFSNRWSSPPRTATRVPWWPGRRSCWASTGAISTASATTRTTSPCWPCPPSPSPRPTAPRR